MKKAAVILIVVAISAILFSSCKKNEDGPREKLTGTWLLQEIKFNDEIQDLAGMTMKFTFQKDGNGIISLGMGPIAIPIDITWDLINSDKSLKITLKDPSQLEGLGLDISSLIPSEVEILKLTDKEFWGKSVSVTKDANNNDVEIVMDMKFQKE